MEMKVMFMATSVGIPHTPLGISLGSGTYLGFRANKASHVFVYGIPKGPSIGKTESLVFGSAKTQWFELSEESRLPDISDLSGYTGSISLKQTGIYKVDVKLELFNSKGDGIGSVSKIDVKTEKIATMPHEFEARAIIRAFPEFRGEDF